MTGGRAYKRAEELEGAQREAACAAANAVVAAGAGSGKTTVLAARFVRLLETGRMESGERVHARNVLVLTFTRKAQAEMYARIHGSLAQAAARAAGAEARAGEPGSPPPEPGLAAHLAASLAEFSQAQISTFDAFAARVARSGCARYGIAPDFAVDEERAREAAADLALGFILERREEEELRELVSALGLSGARDDLLAELAVRRMALSSPPDFAACHAAQAARLEELAAASREGLLAMRAAALDYAGAKTTETSARWLAALAADPGEDEASLLAFLGGLEGLRKPGANSRDEASLFLSEAVPGIRKAAEECRGIAATRAAHPGRLALYRRLDEFRARWDESRRAGKVLGFRDVAELALDTLKSDSSVRRHYQRLYRFVMIDEFQDDDELQKRVLYLLAARPGWEPSPGAPEPSAADLCPDKLFFVGDEKQSIYLFRGADVSVFRSLAVELGGPGGAGALGLSRNFRSEPGLIALLNAIFPSVMAPRDPDRGPEPFEAEFVPLESRPPTPGVEPRLAYLELPRREEGGEGLREAAECEAWEVARIVRDAVEGRSLLVADRASGLARPARYGDFALLLRSTGKQVHFEKYFRLLGVPYGAENACGLFSEAVACDLYYALRLAALPGDRNALAAYLRSPFAAIPDESVVLALLALAAEGREASPFSPEASSRIEGLVAESARPAWRRACATIRTVQAMADRASVARCLCYLWYEAGYRASLLADPVASAFEEHFELLHSLAVEADSRGRPLAAFVAGLEGLVGAPDKLEIDLPREQRPGVRIMTIHKSKGLEFPVVILPQANNVGRDGGSGAAWYWEEGLGPTFKPPEALGSKSRNAFFEASRERREAMESAELKRLLYVALTRAESHLIVTAVAPRGEDARGRSFRSLLAGPLGLFEPPSPLAPGGAPAPGGAELPPFGPLSRLASGALVGLIPERSDLEYYALVARARGSGGAAAGGAAPAPAAPPPSRPALPPSEALTAIAERFRARRAAGRVPAAPPGEALEAGPGLEPPPGLAPELFGSLVHARLEARLSTAPAPPSLPPALLAALEGELGEGAGREAAIAAADRLAELFLGSELGRRALASAERYVEWRIAIAYRSPSGAERIAKASVDLAFVERGEGGEGRVVVVDYKTDERLEPERHELQVAAYRRAAAEILGLPAEAWIFYLYGGGRAVPVDADGAAPSLSEAPEPEFPDCPFTFSPVLPA
ncbi:MAG TPA: UvrD-helicase domain-containing protein [Spirochaetia bacterium]|nr:UvrD-helicase domain-containing protein [Spirochaetia bacterium]